MAILAAIIAGASAVFAALVGKTRPPRSEAAGRILSPESLERVPRAFVVKGMLSAIPRGSHIWIVVQVGNLLFPKEPEIPAQDRRWSQQVVEAGVPSGEGFSLALLLVEPKGQRAIEYWLERGTRGEGFPGLDVIPGSVKLDVVPDLVMR